MTDINVAFARRLLSQVHADVRKRFPAANLITAIGVTGPHGRDQYFVEIQFGDFPRFAEYFRADSKTHAKAKAWLKYLERNVPGYAEGIVEA